ncbi:MAG: M6 family metalloprotease domain-containing protein [Muribaculaceae bacterium]|nr:M6 family metalloprotease domain-containing protein [Muribaculaceae bacterium]
MKIQSILTLAALATPFIASARPASPALLKLHNPDGSVVEARLHGDEFFSYTTTADGLTILEPDVKGFWTPAMRAGKVLRPVESDLTLLRAELPVFPELTSRQERMAELDKEGRSTYPCRGEVHSPVILVQFQDTKFSVNNIVQAIHDLCNKEGYSDYDAKGSAADYFRDCSNGTFRPVFDVYGPMTLSHDAEYYVGKGTNLPGAGKNGRFFEIVKEAVLALDDEIDFSKYDYDENDKVDNIFFFYAGYGQADSGDPNTLWPHQGDYSQYVNLDFTEKVVCDGKEIATFACSNELDGSMKNKVDYPYLDGIGAFTHEFGHVLGLPDLYDTTGSNAKTPGYWDVMANGTYNRNSTLPPMYSAYEKWVCGWLDYTEVEDGTEYSLPSLTTDGTKALRVRIRRPGASLSYYPEYFVIETRSDDSWDAGLASDGILIWGIDYNASAWVRNQVNTSALSRVKILMPFENPMQPTQNVYTWPGDYDLYTKIYPGIQGALEPQSSYSSSFKVFIDNIAYDRESCTGTLLYNPIKDFPSETTTLQTPTLGAATRTFNLSWADVPEADEYLLTVKRTDSNNREWTVDGYDECSVGKDTNAVVRNISATAWNQNFRAYVRVKKAGFPSNKTSNIVRFVPAELEESGVAQVTPDSMGVSGGHGFITAPEGAEIYTVSGVRTGTDNLPAGIYVVRLGNDVAKVLVK